MGGNLCLASCLLLSLKPLLQENFGNGSGIAGAKYIVEVNMIPITFVNLFKRQSLAQTALPTLPSAGDGIYLQGHGYEVINREWMIQDSGQVEIVIVVQPQINEHGERPFSYVE